LELILLTIEKTGGDTIKEQIRTAEKIEVVCDNLKEFLLEKNRKYGDSALYPEHVFSKQPGREQICTRIDDKLSRIRNSPELRKNDVVDSAGYLILLMIASGWYDLKDLLE
jgi:hypothetical protein